MDPTSTSPLPVRPVPVTATLKRKHDGLSTDDGPSSSSRDRASLEPPRTAADFSFAAPVPGLDPDADFDAVSSYFVAPTAGLSSDGSSSPRSRVAQHFRGLSILDQTQGGSSGVPPFGGGDSDSDSGSGSGSGSSSADRDGAASMKRMRIMPSTPPPRSADHNVYVSSPSSFSATSSPAPGLRTIVDPLRASLTWQDDEITIYDPNDADDDGTGVNGIGFKPTPAMARARAVKRRQQLTEYRKREEREARARRSLHRRTRAAVAAETTTVFAAQTDGPGAVTTTTTTTPTAAVADTTSSDRADAGSAGTTSSTTTQPKVRRVRFLETGPTTIHFLEPEPTVILT